MLDLKLGDEIGVTLVEPLPRDAGLGGERGDGVLAVTALRCRQAAQGDGRRRPLMTISGPQPIRTADIADA
ncbi:hypothetical protein [Micromonospora sp. Llam0]|uniref:hypothetical protein n=1 Tax=Micromonospora sp. Llam0 TaxID=2485143 RepID=UPI000F4760F9|nr:hypothetical protein [Micromonospora sp. Llam0]